MVQIHTHFLRHKSSHFKPTAGINKNRKRKKFKREFVARVLSSPMHPTDTAAYIAYEMVGAGAFRALSIQSPFCRAILMRIKLLELRTTHCCKLNSSIFLYESAANPGKFQPASHLNSGEVTVTNTGYIIGCCTFVASDHFKAVDVDEKFADKCGLSRDDVEKSRSKGYNVVWKVGRTRLFKRPVLLSTLSQAKMLMTWITTADVPYDH
jgi:hypothetical protein